MKKVLAVVMVCLCLVCLFGCEKLTQSEENDALVGCWVHEGTEGQVLQVMRFYKNGIVTFYKYSEGSRWVIAEDSCKYHVEGNLLVLIENNYDTTTFEMSLSGDTLQMARIIQDGGRVTETFRRSEGNVFDMLIPQNIIPQK